MPEYPASSLVVVRIVAMLGGPRGLQHPDNAVRQLCVDLVNVIGRRLYTLASSEEALLQRWNTQVPTDSFPHHTKQLLDHLLQSSQNVVASSSARNYLLCQSFASKVNPAKETEGIASQDFTGCLQEHWQFFNSTFGDQSLTAGSPICLVNAPW